MSFYSHCPRCQKSFSHAQLSTGSAICECGWCDTGLTAQAVKATEKNVIRVMAVTAIAIAGFYGHLVSWGPHAMSIPLIKVQELTGTLTKQGYVDLARACIDLNKWDCAKNAYLGLFRETGDPLGFALLGKMQLRMNEDTNALHSFGNYFRLGGTDGDVALDYARLLEQTGRTQDARKYYEYSITARPEVLPIRATAGIVRLLMKEGRYAEARERILAFHASAGNAKGYLNTELEQLDKRLGPAPSKAANGSPSRQPSSAPSSTWSS